MTDRAAIEADVRAACDARDHAGAAAAIVRGYGPEIVSYLAGVLRVDEDIREVFSVFCEDVCRGLPSFRFDATVRTWSYVIAHRAVLKHLRAVRMQRRRFDGPVDLEAVAAQVHSTTMEHMRTTNRDRLAAIRDQLGPEQRTILILRVDRQLGWRDIAQITSEIELDAEALRRREQTLRKKFETIKRQLRAQLGD
jgi:RNA polymerase sigma-70 factor, ECF subfamily